MKKYTDIYCDYCTKQNIIGTQNIEYNGGYNDPLLFDEFDLCPECMKEWIEKGLDDCYYINELRARIEKNKMK